jgi:hypothetical protein
LSAFCTPHIAGTDANRTAKDELTAVINRHSARRRISVTDLLNPRQAYFSRTHPEIQPSPERQQFMLAGTGFHDAFGRTVSTEEFVEQLVEFRDIVGKIDAFEDIPVELKTSSKIPGDPVAARPAHVEQLGMYCTMVDRPRGYLLYYRRSEYGRPPDLKAYELDFSDLVGIAAEMERRRDLLKKALDSGSPDGLLRCEWFGRDCDYGKICGCDLADPLVRIMKQGTVRFQENPDLAQRLIGSITSFPPGQTLILHDLVWPRRAAYRRMPGFEEKPETPQDRMASLQRRGFEEALNDAIWYGFPGQFKRLRVTYGPIVASIMHFRGMPTLLRSPKGQKEMVDRKRLAEIFPHYIDRLGFECALAGSERGRLIVYYPIIPDDKFMAYDIWFRNLPIIREEMDRRLALLESGAPPDQLPACQPGWMERFCSFAPGCNCSQA